MLSTRVSEEAKKVLHEIGLTEYETRAYLTLLEHGVMTASGVSEFGGVPYSKVYETLNSLERKGWIEVEHGRPSRYFPKAPSEALEAARLRLTDMVNGWKHIVMVFPKKIFFRQRPTRLTIFQKNSLIWSTVIGWWERSPITT